MACFSRSAAPVASASTAGDQERVRAMKALIDSGVTASEAARLASSDARPRRVAGRPARRVGDHGPSGSRRPSSASTKRTPTRSSTTPSRASRSTRSASRIFLPVLQADRDALGGAGDLRGTGALRHGAPAGPHAGARPQLGRGKRTACLLACPPGEQHDLGLIAFGLVLRERGWRITSSGSDTPIETIVDAGRRAKPAAVVLAAVMPEPFEAVAEDQAPGPRNTPSLIGGEGAARRMAVDSAPGCLAPTPVEAAADARRR